MKTGLVRAGLLALVVVLAAGGISHSSSREVEASDTDYLISLQVGKFDTRAGEPAIPAGLSLEAYPPDERGYYLVQFDGIILPEWKKPVLAAGAELLAYVPYNAFITRMTDDQRAMVAGLPHVQWIGIFQPAYRIAPWMSSATAGEVVLTLLTFPGEDLQQIVAQLEPLANAIITTSENKYGGLVRLSADLSRLPSIARINGVLWVEPYVEPELTNDVAREIMDVEDTVWSVHGLYGRGETVAIADTGLDVGQTGAEMSDDFEGRIADHFALGRTGDWSDPNGHGTHVAGSAVGNGRNSGSDPVTHNYATSYAGVAPEAELIFQSIMSADGHLNGIPDDLNTLFQQAYDEGARVHSNSWGSPAAGDYTSYSFQADQFAWDHPDMALLFAAGNRGVDSDGDGVIDLDSIDSPGTAKNVITVGASENNRATGGYNPGGVCQTWGGCWAGSYPANPIRDDALSDDPAGMAAFSSRGPVTGDRTKPDVVAPGTNILSARSHQYTVRSDGESGPGGWTVQSTWGIVDNEAHGGAHSWATGVYTNNQNISLTSPLMDIRTEANTIGFWTRYRLGAGDRGHVEYNNGAQWVDCTPLNAQGDAVTIEGTRDAWTFLSCAVGFVSSPQTFSIRFRLQSDSSAVGDGWWIDDIGVHPSGWGLNFQGGVPSEHYMYMGGTSMATPLVAGSAALVREYYAGRGHAPSAALVRATLINGADNMAPGQYGGGATQEIEDRRPNNVTGWGRVNVQESLYPAAPQTVLYRDISNARGLNVNEQHVYRYEVQDTSVPFRVTLAWIDFPGTPPAGNPRINHDLDLTLKLPDGTLRYPNGRTDRDPDNNVEDVFVNSADVDLGVYTVTVRGANIPDNGPQGYALVARGGNLRELPRIAVNPPQYDDIGAVLTQMGYPWTQVSDSDFASYAQLQQYDTVFANCSSNAHSTGASATGALQQFVQNEGSFYASDWAYTYVNSAFPSYVSFQAEPRIGYSQYVNAAIVDPGLANYLDPANPPSTISLNYNLSAWAVIDSASSDARVHLVGSFTTSAGQMTDKPLAVSFSPYAGSGGRVIYTTFHNEAQQSALEKKLLEYLVLIPSTSQLASEAEQVIRTQGLYVAQTNINIINPGEEGPIITYVASAPTDLMFVANWGGSTLRLEVYRPDGTLYEQKENSSPPIVIQAKDAVSGPWKFRVIAVNVPYKSYPYVVVVGDKNPQAPGKTKKAFVPLMVSWPSSWVAGNGLSSRTVYDLSSTGATCGTVFAGTDAGVYRSTDGGLNWQQSLVPALAAGARGRAPAFDGLASPDAGLTPAVAVCVANPNVVYAAGWGAGVYRSTNGGASWQPRSTGLSDLWVYDLAVAPANCDVAYAATYASGVFKTTDGGGSWQEQNAGLGETETRSLLMPPGSSTRLYVGTTAGVFRTDDAGDSWASTASLPDEPVWALAAPVGAADTVYIGLEDGGVYNSSGAGQSWQSRGLSGGRIRALWIDPLNPQIIYAGDDQGRGIFRSSDAGAGWIGFGQGLGAANVKSLWLDAGTCRKLLAGTTDGVWIRQP
jgi:subtilisin family serine protease/photosystem II stability/assembly factor-like uncharacterized protein